MASRQEKDYGLPPLTVELAARLLGITEQELQVWLMGRLHPGVSRWSQWMTGKRPLPEAILRLYAMDKARAQPGEPPGATIRDRRKGRAG